MSKIVSIAFLSAVMSLSAAAPRIEVLPPTASQVVFGGTDCSVTTLLRNNGDGPVQVDLGYCLLQASSATVIPIGSIQPLKQLTLGDKQTLAEFITLQIPEVKAATRFLLQWRDGLGALGTTEVWAYPNNLLDELSNAAGPEPIGLLDPQELLKPALAKAKVEFENLDEPGLASFRGKLVIIGPNGHESSEEIKKAVKEHVSRGASIVWIQTLPASGPPQPEPLSYLWPQAGGCVVVAPARTLMDLAHSPMAQLNLVQLVHLAARRDRSPWRDSEP